MKKYEFKLIDNIFYMYFEYKGKLKVIDLGTKNYNLAKDRAERYINEYIKK